MNLTLQLSNDEIKDAIREYCSKRGHLLTDVKIIDDCDSEDDNEQVEAIGEYDVDADELLPEEIEESEESDDEESDDSDDEDDGK